MSTNEDELLEVSIDTCLGGLEEFIIDAAKRIDSGDGSFVDHAAVATALHVLRLYDAEEGSDGTN